jgi:hypothetical protein
MRASRIGERHCDLPPGGLVHEHKLAAIGRPQLFFGVEELDPINRAVGGNVHVQLVTDTDGFDANGFGRKRR